MNQQQQRRNESDSRTEAVAELLERQQCGITVPDVVAAIGCTESEARKALYRLHKDGQAVYARAARGNAGIWGRPELLASMLEEQAKRRDSSRKMAKEKDGRLYQLRKAARHALMADPLDYGAVPMMRRVVPANEAPPVVTYGVPSVFHLADPSGPNAREAA